jgi:general secretion pathway protein H
MSEPFWQTTIKKGAAGVTLIEVIVALTITALLTAAAVPAVGNALGRARANGSARELVLALKVARQQARATGDDVLFALDVATRVYRVAPERDRSLAIPQDATLSLLTAESERLGETAGAIRFLPDGSSSGGTITLTHDGRELRIEIDWLTGHVRTVAP